jgi:hypothetical protein
MNRSVDVAEQSRIEGTVFGVPVEFENFGIRICSSSNQLDYLMTIVGEGGDKRTSYHSRAARHEDSHSVSSLIFNSIIANVDVVILEHSRYSETIAMVGLN